MHLRVLQDPARGEELQGRPGVNPGSSCCGATSIPTPARTLNGMSWPPAYPTESIKIRSPASMNSPGARSRLAACSSRSS